MCIRDSSLHRESLNVFFAAPGGRLFEGEKKKGEEEKRKEQEQQQQQEQKREKIRRECSPIFFDRNNNSESDVCDMSGPSALSEEENAWRTVAYRRGRLNTCKALDAATISSRKNAKTEKQ